MKWFHVGQANVVLSILVLVAPVFTVLASAPIDTPKIASQLHWRPAFQVQGETLVSQSWRRISGGWLFHRKCRLPRGARLVAPSITGELELKAPFRIYFSPHHFYQAPIVYGSFVQPGAGSFVYLQNLSSLGAVMDLAASLPSPIVDISGNTIGWKGVSLVQPSIVRDGITLSDSYFLWFPFQPETALERARLFLQAMEVLVREVTPPFTRVSQWDALSDRSMRWLEKSDNWFEHEGKRHLTAYVNAPRAWAELITQVGIAEPLFRYQHFSNRKYELFNILNAGLSWFFQNEIGSVANPLPFVSQSAGDSWYYFFSLVKLADLAHHNENARILFRTSLSYAVNFARRVNYRFPVFFRWVDAMPLSSERAIGTLYAYLYAMVAAMEIFPDERGRWLYEAKSAAEIIGEKEFYGPYQLQLEAIGAAALAKLGVLTGDSHYFDLSLQPLAYLFAHCSYAQADWAFRDSVPTFMALAAQPHLYPAPMEQHVASRYLAEWLRYGEKRVPDSAKRLAQTFIRFSGGIVRYSYPDVLPPEVVSPWSPYYNLVNDPKAPVPLEDLRWDRKRMGLWGQEIYGAGAALDMAQLARDFGSARARAGAGFLFPRGVILERGKSAILNWVGEAGLDSISADAPPGLNIEVFHSGQGPRVRLTASSDVSTGRHSVIVWARSNGRSHPFHIGVEITAKFFDWSNDLVNTVEAWSVKMNDAMVNVGASGLRLQIAPGRDWAVAAIPYLRLPREAKELVVRARFLSTGARYFLKLSADWDGDGLPSGAADDVSVPPKPLLSTGPTVVALGLAKSGHENLTLRLLQIAIQGRPGDVVVIDQLDFR